MDRNRKVNRTKQPGTNRQKQSHSGGFLPLVFAGLAALGSLVGGGAAVVKAIDEDKNKRKEIEEIKRHNRAMELKKGSGLKKPKTGTGSNKKKVGTGLKKKSNR